MKRLSVPVLALLLLVLLTPGAAAQRARVFRSEFITFDRREDAVKRERSKAPRLIECALKQLGASGEAEMYAMSVDIPLIWSDCEIYIHLENCGKAYKLAVNSTIVAGSDDACTPADFLLTPWLRQGSNEIVLLLSRPRTPRLNDDAKPSSRPQFDNCYIYAQPKLHVFDYEATIRPDSAGTLHLALDVALANSFGSAENANIGYDIYGPDGRLIDYGFFDVQVAGRSCDTLRIRRSVGSGTQTLWGGGRTPLYKIMLYQRRTGRQLEYMQVNVGAGTASFDGQQLVRNGKPVEVRCAAFNAAADRKSAAAELKALKARGVNTVIPANPQPAWFYDLCDETGVYVIDRANNNPRSQSSAASSLSNNPVLADEYLTRVQAMYYRSRNHACVIAYALGGDNAGNGYNFYNAYRWLKSVEHDRAVICPSAGGEWNTDIDFESIKPQQ